MGRISLPRSARRGGRTALALWFLLAVVVFNVRFDWQVRAANHAFVRSQIVRHQQGLPTLTINDTFRPMVSEAARDAALWFAVVAIGGAAATVAALSWHKAS